MKRLLYVVISILFVEHAYATLKENMEFYKKIANAEYVILSNEHVKIKINTDYTVSINGEWERSSSYSKEICSLSGTGNISMNGENLEIKLNGSIDGKYKYEEEVYRTESEYNVGSGTVNTLLFVFDVLTLGSLEPDYAPSRTYKKVYDYTKRSNASGNNSFNITLVVDVADNKLYLKNTPSISVYMSGTHMGSNHKEEAYHKETDVSLGQKYTITYGNKINAEESIDQYGSWDWKEKDNAILLQLKSTNKLENYHAIMQITIPQDKRSLKLSYLFLSAAHIKSKTVQTIKEGYMLNEFTISCNDGTCLTLPFVMQEKSIKNNEGTKNLYNSTCVYATYDRFNGTYKSNAYSIVSQLRSKEILFFEVLINNTPSSFNFELEGLDILLNKYNI